jgi:hypothetical protein
LVAAAVFQGIGTTGRVTMGGVSSFTKTSSHSRCVSAGRLRVTPAATATTAKASEMHTLLSVI